MSRMLLIQTKVFAPADTPSAPIEMVNSHKQDRATHHMAWEAYTFIITPWYWKKCHGDIYDLHKTMFVTASDAGVSSI